jgi:hypothetical protein
MMCPSRATLAPAPSPSAEALRAPRRPGRCERALRRGSSARISSRMGWHHTALWRSSEGSGAAPSAVRPSSRYVVIASAPAPSTRARGRRRRGRAPARSSDRRRGDRTEGELPRSRRITLLDREALLELSVEHYDELDEEARGLLPIKAVHFLDVAQRGLDTQRLGGVVRCAEFADPSRRWLGTGESGRAARSRQEWRAKELEGSR